ncbi:hypothetical protein OE88DRAFT_1674600 [Heliocybe sulcata]|uniref:Nucleoporin Nup133/Nup155-like C-terminal domain-containing protein n=1 Tax=Heliocybe sulcata TaxID=5364 RepID=A0A5C3NDV8_9AGAM|nr:hypothetical protein OE88DRAFT_1674600 [Heliocybe sulcata]
MSFSPAPRRPHRVNAARRAAQSPLQGHVPRGNSLTATRRATPVLRGTPDRASPFADDVSMVSASSDAEGSRASTSDGRLRAEGVFARSDQLDAVFYANLPVEVKQVLKNVDFYTSPYSGEVDTLTGFALVSTAQKCFVWKHAQALTGTPTCYIFACPLDYVLGTTPLHCLVPFGSGREPGLILISSSGETRFWDSIASGLAGGEHFVSIQLGLSTGETVTTLTRADAVTYIASTSIGRLLRLTVTSDGSKYHIAHHIFSRPQSAHGLARFLPGLWAEPTPQIEKGYVSSVALGKESESGQDVWALVNARIQKWNMTADDWEEVVLDEEVISKIRDAVRATNWSNVPLSDYELDLDMLDLHVEKTGKLLLLCSYFGTEHDAVGENSTRARRVYLVAQMSHWVGSLSVDKVTTIPYQTTSSSGAPIRPRMTLMASGSLVAVQFGDAVALCSRETEYRDRIALKSASDRTLGLGAVEQGSELLIMTATTIMKVVVDMEKVADFDPVTGGANIVKSIMTQAVLYGTNPENPLDFSFPPGVDEGSLMSGATQLSESILESDPELLRPNVDMQAQLQSREELLSFLIQFINDNAVLPKVSQTCRQQLASHAEKQFAARELWLMHNKYQSVTQSHSVLNEAIHNYLSAMRDDDHADPERAFFRKHVSRLGELMVYVMDVTRRSSYEMNRKLLEALMEANRVVYMIIDSGMHFRRNYGAKYGIQEPMYNPWTSAPPMIDIVFELFNMTTKIIETPTVETGTAAQYVKEELKKQIPDIGGLVFGCMTERLDWLKSPVAATEPGNDKEKTDLQERFAASRPQILDTIRRVGYPEKAFHLAEYYHDLRSLASLCHKDKVYPPDENPYLSKIQASLDHFREAFAMELFQWYVENGELRTLFAQQERYGDYIDMYFAQHPNPTISWINDIGKGRYGAASESLLEVAKGEGTLEVKHLMLSIGKLSQLAQLHEPNASVEEKVLNAFHDGLDFISVHETLLEKFRVVLEAHKGKQSHDAQADTVVRAKAKSLANRKYTMRLFKDLIRQLLQGKALGVEDIVDLLTLKDNDGEEMEDYTTALQLVDEAKVSRGIPSNVEVADHLVPQDLPKIRIKSAVRSVWRRIYMHDDWATIKQTKNLTDAELTARLQNTALYQTLLSVLSLESHPDEYTLLRPRDCQEPPSAEEISARFPGMDPDAVEALVDEFEAEGVEVIESGVDEDGIWERVLELVRQAQEGGPGRDVPMEG